MAPQDIKVTIVTLQPMIVASVYAFGDSPEEEALQLLHAWAEPRNLMNDKKRKIFGFNNPPPSRPGQKYGYELWLAVDPATEPDKNVRVCLFKGGKYAVTRCKGARNISATWASLFEWCKANKHEIGTHQGLEQFVAGDDPETMTLDLYCPILA
nr:GyrI-like domain-containing protein [Candidatus Sigynarchaeota archaeon]